MDFIAAIQAGLVDLAKNWLYLLVGFGIAYYKLKKK